MISLLFLSSVFVSASAAPCDIFALGGTPCVAAYSVVRAMFDAYTGPLYQVNRSSDGETYNVSVLSPGGYANSAVQDAFCASTSCSILRIFDQTTLNNHLDLAPAGGAAPHPDGPACASCYPITVNGHKVYSVRIEKGMGYRIDNTSGVAQGNDPETIYMVTSGPYNSGCCFDFGNAESNNHDTGAGSMESVYVGSWNATYSGWCGGSGEGPWVMADLEDGLWTCNETYYVNPLNQPITATYTTAMVKGGSNGFSVKSADATQGTLSTLYDGPRPPGYQPMRKQGSVILGIGGDNSDSAIGTWFEGVLTAGYSTPEADNAVQANIVGAGYGK
jgi:hypothetical protein